MSRYKYFYTVILFHLRFSLSFNLPILEIKGTNKLKDVLWYSFREFTCISLYQDNNTIPNEYYVTIYESMLPVILEENQKYCQGYLIFVQNISGLNQITSKIQKHFSNRLVYYIIDKSIDLEEFAKMNHQAFGDAEVLLTTDHKSYIMRSLGRLHPIQIMNSIDPWREYKPIYNFMGKEFKIGTFNLPIYVNYGTLDIHGNTQWNKGIELRPFATVAEMINISWRIFPPSSKMSKWGQRLDNGTFMSGIYKMLQDGEVDIAFASSFMNHEKYESFHMSTGMNILRLRYLVTRPSLISNWISIFDPFPLEMWILLLVATIMNSLCFAFFTRIKYSLDKTFMYKGYASFKESNFLSLGILLMSGIPQSKKEQGPLRILINSWVVTCLLLTTCFGSSLVSHLSTPDLVYFPETIRELVENGYYWGLNTTIINYSLILDMDNKWHREWARRNTFIESERHHLQLLEDDKFAVWGKSIDRLGFMLKEEYLPMEKLIKKQVINEAHSNFYFTYLIRKGSQIIPAFERALSQLVESGHMDKILRDEFSSLSEKYMTEVMVKTKPSVGASSLAISNYKGLFYLLLGGLTIAAISFFFEFILFKLEKRIQKI